MAYTSKATVVRPPLKGAFPLDHDAECKAEQVAYMGCLKANEYLATKCRDASRTYLDCRMNKGLMSAEEMEKLGFDARAAESADEFNRRLATGDLKVKPKGR
jgi:cytochrome c oxidase assembly protein subunit 19